MVPRAAPMETIRSPRSRGIHNASRLSRLYAQHKTAKPPVSAHDAPEILSLHRKFRIQKDRLISWGFEWKDASDGDSEQDHIDAALARAGLTELVSSIMDNIQHINEEIDHLGSETVYTPGVFRPDSKTPQARRPRTTAWTQEETAQYGDLVKDYTKAIDLLCDLPKSRKSMQQQHVRDPLNDPSQLAWAQNIPPESWPAELQLVDHELLKLDNSLLDIPDESPPSYDNLGTVRCTRNFGYLRRPHIILDSYNNQREILPQPVLIEYATYDSIYKENNVPLPMARLEQLYMQSHSREALTEKCLPQLLGYFTDSQQPRYGLVFMLPDDIAANIPAVIRTYNSIPHTSLLDLLQTSSRLHSAPHPSASVIVPTLEERFRLAHELVSGLSFLHDRSFPHRDISSNSITLLPKAQNVQSNNSNPHYDLRRPLIGSFDLFSEFTIDEKPFEIHQNLYRHPDDPKVRGTLSSEDYEPRFDLYSLGLVLLEIGLWSPIADTFKDKYSLHDFKTRIERIWVKKLAGKCGSVYMRAVQDCLAAGSNPKSGIDKTRQIYDRVKLRLARCCVVDDSDLDETPDTGLTDLKDPETEKAPPSYAKPAQKPQAPQVAAPNVFWDKPLPETVEHYWQSELAETVGEIVDRALKSSKESMVLGLAYTGETEPNAKLTVLVGCESVETVSAALDHHLHIDRNIFNVVVHSGQVVWSKAPKVRRSAGDAYGAKNGHHQIKPVCGASIGAWRNNEHLPPVTFGGVVMIDGERYGMSVHHMLEDTDEDSEEESNIVRSAGLRKKHSGKSSASKASQESTIKLDEILEEGVAQLSVQTYQPAEEGDTSGVGLGAETITITQPALEDVVDKEDFFPVPEDMDEDHLDSHAFGSVYASSGLRRTTHQGLKQEVDWALIKIHDTRSQPYNLVPGGRRHLSMTEPEDHDAAAARRSQIMHQFRPEQDHCPRRIASSRELKGLPVHCVGRTSGLGSGKIAATLWQVRFPGRSKRSWAWVVTGGIGLPGDSGAWLVDNNQGRVCGHILGYIGAHNVAIFSPMDLMIEDIRTTLNASEVCLPGGSGNTIVPAAADRDFFVPVFTTSLAQPVAVRSLAPPALPESSQGVEMVSLSGKHVHPRLAGHHFLTSGNPGHLEREWSARRAALGQRTLG